MKNGLKRKQLSADSEGGVVDPKETEAKRSKISHSENPPPQDQRRTLFVRSLPASVTTERLTEFFSQSYPLKHATVVLDSKTKASRGYGFVTFADPQDAQAATAELDNAELDGRRIKLEVAEPRHREVPEDGGRSKPSSKTAEIKAERERKRAELLPPKLIVRNLPWTIKEPEDLAVLFRSYGKVKRAIVPKRGPNVQAGFGFVLLRGRKNAERAIDGVNGKVVDGRPLAVDWAVDKETWESLQASNQSTGADGLNPSHGSPDEDRGKEGISDESDEGEDALGTEALGTDDAQSPTSSHGDGPDNANGVYLEGEEMESASSEGEEAEKAEETPSSTIFIRNLPFASTDEMLHAHFSQFGAVRYARVVYDPGTERPRGTGFVCFFREEDAKSCVKGAPKNVPVPSTSTDRKRKGETLAHSVLQNEAADPTGRYTLEGRILQVSKALSKSDAARREAQGSSQREIRDRDRRRLYLLSEGTIPKGSKLYEQLGATEINIREASAKQRQKLIKSNPSLHMSLTRLSVRNIPRSVTSKDLKALAREAVVGFATDVKNGVRLPLSKEELKRAADGTKDAEKLRKQQGKGIVKQAKIVFEGREGAKVDEKSGAGRSRGYGFIEYVSHRAALMGLRWLNGHAVKAGAGDRSKRLIVEFAIENAQVVSRRNDREARTSLQRPRKTDEKVHPATFQGKMSERTERRNNSSEKDKEKTPRPSIDAEGKNRIAKRNRVISKKRNMRKSRKVG